MKVIYKRDVSGKVRYLKVSTKEDNLIQESGVLDTDSPITHSKACTGKNKGKTNETTPEEQAKSEMASLIKSKLDEGYFLTQKEAETEEVILPMLAKSYKDEKDKIDWQNCFVQPKFDGMRCLAFVKKGAVTLMSRKGKEITTVPFINDALSSLKDGIYDGELYAHGIGFQGNMELIKKYRPGKSESIKFHCYDMISDEPFDVRHVLLQSKLAKYDGHIVSVETQRIHSESDLNKYHKLFLSEGYEGSIVRLGGGKYKVNGRSSDLLKYKDFQDIAAKIIDITPAESRPEWGVPTLEWKGKKFQAGTKMSHEERKELLINKKNYIGKLGEIRYFELSEEGIPRFPIFCGVRLDK